MATINKRAIFDLADEAVAGAAEELKNMAQIEAPYVTGFLHDNITVERYAASSYAVVSNAPYSLAVHKGHAVKNRKGGDTYGETTGNPFMRRAIENLAQ